jgi:putative ABC transport system permease protein
MRWFQKAQSFVRNLLSFARVESDLDHEIHSHLEMLTEENLRAGMPPVAALRAAQLELGGMEQVKEQVREERTGNWLHAFVSDTRFAWRQVGKSPAFAITAVLTIALGIAINATMFSLVSAFVLSRPLVHEPERIAVITSVSPTEGFRSDAMAVSVPNYLAWRDASRSFSAIAAADESRTANLASRGPAEAVPAAAVTPNYFSVLGVSPELGRAFSDGEDQPGRNHVVVLSHELWEHRFLSDASLVTGARTIRLNREDYTVIGVMPASFRLLGFTTQLWTPLVLSEADRTPAARKDRSLYLFARCKPEATLDEARAEVTALAQRAGESFPETDKGWGVKLRTLPDFLTYTFGFRSGGALMMATAAFILMIACANVSGLVLARAARRQKELGIRIALGASRLRIIRQLLTENLLLALIGGGLGVLLADWGVYFLRARMNFNDAISAAPISLDWKVLLFAAGVTLLSVVLCGLAPTMQASRTDIAAVLKDESRSSSAGVSHTRLRTLMVAGQVSLALLLLIGTGLLFRAIFVIEHQDLGFQTENLLTAAVTLDDAHYRDSGQRRLFVQNTLSRLRQIPGVETAAVASDLPATGAPKVTLQISGQPELAANERLTALDVIASPEYLEAAGIPLLRGRTLSELDSADSPRVILVNQDFVRRVLKDQDPLGRRVRLDVVGSPPLWSEIVGVVANVKSFSEDARVEPQVYEAFGQRPVASFSFMLRSASDPNGIASALRRAAAEADPELPLDRVMSMPRLIERQRAGDPLFIEILATFALLALLLAAIGIYGLVAYSVSQRFHEIAIRMAMGARVGDVRRMILWQGTKITATGAAIGLLLALPLPKLFEAMFFSIRFQDSGVYLFVPVVILLVATLAMYIPARRASGVDPMRALRQD